MTTRSPCIAVAARGSMYDPGACFYMEKLVTGPEAADVVDIRLARRREHRTRSPRPRAGAQDVTVVLLDRPRHAELIDEIRRPAPASSSSPTATWPAPSSPAGPRPASTCCWASAAPPRASSPPRDEVHGRRDPGPALARNDDERRAALDAGIDLDRVLTTDDLVTGDDCFFVATGITDGELMRGVHYGGEGATTHSLVMRLARAPFAR